MTNKNINEYEEEIDKIINNLSNGEGLEKIFETEGNIIMNIKKIVERISIEFKKKDKKIDESAKLKKKNHSKNITNVKYGVGFKNYELNCWMNSIIQLLYSCEDFVSFINNSRPTTTNNYLFIILKEIFRLMETLMETKSNRIINLENIDINGATINVYEQFTELLKNINSENDNLQNDPTEFLYVLIDVLNASDIFKFSLESRLECTNAPNKIKYTSQIILNVIRPETNHSYSLQELIELHDKHEHKDTFDACNNNEGTLTHKYIIPDDSNYLILCLLFRLNFRGASTQTIKDSNPIRLDKKLKINGKDFEILGCIVHRGEFATGGHYVYYEFYDEYCILKNDSDIKRINGTNIPDEIETGGYVFLYKINNPS